MKLGRNIGSVTIPKHPKTLGGVLSWIKRANRTMEELRDRKVGFTNAKKPGSSASLPITLKAGTAANKFQVIPGYVNSVMPTLGGTALNATVGDPPLPPEITVTVDVWVWVKCVGTFGSPDTYVITIVTSASSTEPAGTEITTTGFTSYFYIGNVDFTSGSPDNFVINNTHGGGNVGVRSFGNINDWFRR